MIISLIDVFQPPLGDLGGWIIKPGASAVCAVDDWFGVEVKKEPGCITKLAVTLNFNQNTFYVL